MKRSEVLKLRKIIEMSAQSLTDDIALQAVTLYPMWTENTDYNVGYKVRRDSSLYRCIQAHTSLMGWEPENTPSLWEKIDETHSGAIEDPIPYNGNMALINGLYYIQDFEVYLCTRDTVNPVYNALADLVGVYVEKV